MSDLPSPKVLQEFARRIESLEAEIAERNSDKSDVYKEAKGGGFNVEILRKVITYRRKREKHGQAALDEGQTVFDLYMEAIEGKPLARARARDTVLSQEPPVDAEGQGGGGEAGRGEGSHPRLPSDRVENKPDGPAVVAAVPHSKDQHPEAGTHQPAPPQPKPGGAEKPGTIHKLPVLGDAGPMPGFLDARKRKAAGATA
jgi:uncharacterized protein (UPF0335 family)